MPTHRTLEAVINHLVTYHTVRIRIVLQFGYLVMFAAACPLVALVMFVSNVVELRLDAIKLVRYVERPVPERTSNIGIWSSILNMLFLCGLLTNVCEH